MSIIDKAIKLKDTHIIKKDPNDYKEACKTGHPGEMFVETKEGNQGIIPENIFQEMEREPTTVINLVVVSVDSGNSTDLQSPFLKPFRPRLLPPSTLIDPDWNDELDKYLN
ncbi:MAG: hypothetical protein FD167_1961 [bacterium]|nr:MAG: hypothetical protein FD167_1961 [bacterium]